MLSSSNVISLAAFREALAERFPEAVPLPARQWATGWKEIDAAEGGLPHNAVTELCSAPGCGGFFLHRVLASLRERWGLAGLVDCGRSFDPGSYDAAAFCRLLTVFCETVEQSVKVTDLLLRDGNLPLVLLDLQTMPLRSLGRIPASTWHRFQRLVERSGTTLVVMTPQPIVEAARVRISLDANWSLAALKRPRRELFANIRAQVFRRGKQTLPQASSAQWHCLKIMSWFAAILLPQFSLQAALRLHEEAWLKPVAIIEGDTEKGRVLEMTEVAARSGVWRGMVVTQALARCPALRLLPPARAQEEAVSALLLETTGRLSPFIEATAEDLCIADLRQMKAGDWEQWAHAVVERFAARELRARVGVAANPDLAALAARRAEPALVVQHPGAFLASIAVSEVDASLELVAILRDWGISHLGELARLPRGELVERLGPAASELWEHATGRKQRQLRLVRPPEIFCEAFDFEHPIETTEPLLFILRRQLEQLTLRLGEAYRVAAQMTLTITLEHISKEICESGTGGKRAVASAVDLFPGTDDAVPSSAQSTAGSYHYERVFTVPSPTGDTEVLFRILHTHLENLQLEQQPIGVRLRIEPVIADKSQFQFFESPLRDPNRFGETLGRLAALVGARNVGVVQLEDTHQPDRFQLVTPEFQKFSDNQKSPVAQSRTLGLPLQRFRPPRPAQVHFQRHIPIWLSSSVSQGKVIDAAGPYRVSGHWWDHHAWSIEEWDIELSDGALYRISKCRGSCFLEGCYDAPVR